MNQTAKVRSGPRVLLGQFAFGIGLLLLIAGATQRWDGQLSWGPRNGPMKTLPREKDPEFFDRVTYGLIAAGLLLGGGGLALAWFGSSSKPGVPPKRSTR